MSITKLIPAFKVQTHPHEHWAILGSNAANFAKILTPAKVSYHTVSENLDGVLLLEALSAQSAPVAWLDEIIDAMGQGAALLVVDWQADGPLDRGPNLKQRFKRGKLCRHLRQAGFGVINTIENQPAYYIVQAVKEPPPHTSQSGKFIAVADLDKLSKNQMKPVELFGHQIIVANTGREIVAFAQQCPHANGNFSQGRLRGRNVICPLHFYIWNVCSGEPVEPSDEDTLLRYAVKVDKVQQKIYVAIPPFKE